MAATLITLVSLIAQPAEQDAEGRASVAALTNQLLPGGAAILMDIADGRVIAAGGESLLTGEARPAGSVLKLFTVVALVGAGAATDEVFYCPPSSPGVPATAACWYRPGHGNMSLRTALASSCNSYFRQWLQGKDPAPALELFEQMGLISGRPEGDAREIARALLGLSPQIRIRPLRLAAAAGALFNGGVLYSIGSLSEGAPCRPTRRIALSEAALELVREGMRECAAWGTGREVGAAVTALPTEPKISLLVKTGTSVHWGPAGADPSATDGWCLVAFPAARPRYLLLVLAPGSTGSEGAARAAAAIVKTFLEDRTQ